MHKVPHGSCQRHSLDFSVPLASGHWPGPKSMFDLPEREPASIDSSAPLTKVTIHQFYIQPQHFKPASPLLLNDVLTTLLPELAGIYYAYFYQTPLRLTTTLIMLLITATTSTCISIRIVHIRKCLTPALPTITIFISF